MRHLFITLSFFLFTSWNTFCSAADLPYESLEMPSGYITVVDEQGSIILQTGLMIRPGDQYIDEDNRRFEVTAIEGTLAKAHYVQNEASISLESMVVPAQSSAGNTEPLIAIYHSHTDECYIPYDGRPSIPGKGSIMLVGDAFSDRLTELGYQVAHSKTLHDPHDANAYQRSRRTFMRLLKQQPIALFDIHRDSAPLNVYRTTINGEDTSRILLVVGRQNQNRTTTLDYARSIKAAADAKYRSLIRGIFIAHGNYNQDLNPRAMLVEVGTQYNTLQAAEHSVALFADVIPAVLALSTPGATASVDNNVAAYIAPEMRYGYDILFIIGALLLGIVAYLYLSTGSWQEAKRKLYQFRNYEFTNFLGFRKKRKK
jgi:stage II sporulation protein P